MMTSPQHPASSPSPASSRIDGLSIDLPTEICFMIRNRLSGVADLAACACVSKGWHAMFSPLLYMTLDLREYQNRSFSIDKPFWIMSIQHKTQEERLKKFQIPSSDTLVRYGHHIQSLTLERHSYFKEGTFSSIASLHHLRLHNQMPFLDDHPKLILNNNPGLQKLDLIGTILHSIFSSIPRVCPNLERLRIDDSSLNLNVITGLQGCRRLLYLSLKHCQIDDDRKNLVLPEIVSPSLQEYEIVDCSGSCLETLMEAMPRCPRLKGAAFNNHYSVRYRKVRFNHCPELSRVAILNFGNDRQIAQMLDSCHNSLEEISIIDCDIGEHTIASVRRHFGTLAVFRLVQRDISSQVGSFNLKFMQRMVQERKLTEEVFRSCPNLIHLECPRLNSLTLLPKETAKTDWDYELDADQKDEPSPSGSLGLKTLKVGWLDRGYWMENPQELVRLPVMKGLEEIVFSEIGIFDHSKHRTRPDNGVFLPEGDFERSQLEQNKKLRWMLKLWPKLTHFINGNDW